MSFKGPTTTRNIKVRSGQRYRLFLTQQDGGYWVATVLYGRNGAPRGKHIARLSKADAYGAATKWVLRYVDSQAVIDPL